MQAFPLLAVPVPVPFSTSIGPQQNAPAGRAARRESVAVAMLEEE